MAKVNVNGTSLCYRQVGEGPDLVLIHGLAANHAFWNLLLLLPLAREFRVTTYDLRGHGYSGMSASGYTSKNMAQDLFGLLDALDIERAHLVGHSFGGVVALHAAATQPQRVRSLTIQDSRVRALQPHQRLRDWPDWKEAQQKLAAHGIHIDENADEVGIELLTKLAAPEWRERSERMDQKPLFVPFSGWSKGNRSADRWRKLLATTNARAELTASAGLSADVLRTIQHPTLAIYGEHSRCLTTCQQLPTTLGQCRTHIMPGVGHFYPVIRPVAVAELVLEFLHELEQDAAARSPRESADASRIGPLRA